MSNPVNSSDELHLRLKSSAYRQKGGDTIKYLFLSPPLRKGRREKVVSLGEPVEGTFVADKQ